MIRSSRVNFVGFLKSWVASFSRKNYMPGGWERDHAAFFDAIPDFLHLCEHIRADLPTTMRAEFSERIARIQNKKRTDFYTDKYDQLLEEFEELVRFIEKA